MAREWWRVCGLFGSEDVYHNVSFVWRFTYSKRVLELGEGERKAGVFWGWLGIPKGSTIEVAVGSGCVRSSEKNNQ